MSDQRDSEWAAFDALGIEEIRKRLGARQYGDQREKLAREWLAHHETSQVAFDNAAMLAEAKATNLLAREANLSAVEANEIARAASASAKRSAAAARTNNIIATAALIAAIIAIVVSITGIHHQ